jgi:putative FmdB family regulatory protein
VPIYEYYCTQCGARYEKLAPVQKANRAGRCPECGSRETHRVMSACAALSGAGSDSACQPFT